jgi:hypothetical protein
MGRRSGAPIARKAGLRSTFKKTLPPCRIRNAMPVFNRQTRNAPNNAPKHLNQGEGHRSGLRRSRTEADHEEITYEHYSVIHYTLRRKLMTTVTSRQHHHQRHRQLHDAGDALLSRDLTTETSCQRHHQCHPPLYDPGDDPGDEPRDPLLRRDPTPAAVQPRSRRLRFRRVYRRDIHGVARSWRHHRSGHAVLRYFLMKKKTNNTRVKKRKRTTMGKSLPRGGMTVATV